MGLAASLLPPLVNCGLVFVLGFDYPHLRVSTGYTLHEVALCSFGMYLATASNVVLFAFITFKCKHVGGFSLGLSSKVQVISDAMTSIVSLGRRSSMARQQSPASSIGLTAE